MTGAVSRSSASSEPPPFCRRCPVKEACAAFAQRTGQAFGVWGGLGEADRGHTRQAA
ncbi:WhiB family transcriptional regulator [Catenulispora sp. GP43]|uniref:WhiB family transcriptional regulator n=1 Tax=Catenulispora sp. GP43 TaxID=3156263 RepID=UPI00351398E2